MVRLLRSAGPGSREQGSEGSILESEGMLGAEEDIASPDGHVIGWAPGYSPNVAPAGTAWRLEPGTSVALELHVQTTGKPEQVQSSVGLFFTNDAPTVTPVGLQLGSYTIDIPPGAQDYIVEDRYEAGSLLITSQVPVDRWYDVIGIPTLADAVLDRVVHNAYRIELSGESLRKRQAPEPAT